MTPDRERDAVLESLTDLLEMARANIVAWVAVMERVETIRALRGEGMAYRDMDAGTGSPPIIAAVAANQERLTAAAAAFRRALAQQLHDEGMSVADIARAFGVSRQRVSNLVQGAATGLDEESRGD